MKIGAWATLTGGLIIVAVGAILGGRWYINQNSKPAKLSPVAVKCANELAIVPHIEAAKEFRESFWPVIKSNCRPEAVVVISPNHYGSSAMPVIVTGKDWTIAEGTVSGNAEMAHQLEGESVLYDDNAFIKEHGISNLLGEFNAFYQNVPVVAVMVGSNATDTNIDDLKTKLEDVCTNCLIVGSVDFSHTNPEALAGIHDQTTLRELKTVDATGVQKGETDAPMVLSLMVKLAKSSGAIGFAVNKNGCIASQPDADSSECTTYMTGSFSVNPTPPESMTSFMMAGDVMLDRTVYHTFKTVGMEKIWSDWGPRRFWGTDIAMLNLEGPISKSEINDDYLSGSMVFNFPPDSADTIKYAGVNTVSLANNHTQNAGNAGLSYTKSLLTEKGIGYIGNPSSLDADSVKDFETPVPLRIITMNYLEEPETDWIIAKIVEGNAAGRKVIVYPHWGNEYQAKASPTQVDLAHSFIDAGATMVIGSHPHVVQNIEIYKNRPIVYSLGNFIFDQTFSEETQQGLVVAGTITNKQIEINLFPTKQIGLKPRLMIGEEKRTTLDALLAPAKSYLKGDTIVLDI